jgi:hypothetical protein
MADFFKGLAGGFGTGLQFGQAMRERDERERLREAMGLTPQEMAQRPATPEELGRAQAETQRLATQDAAEFGLTPQDQAMYAPQMPVEDQMRTAQYGLGGQTFSRMPTQQEINSARYAAAANVIAERDPVAAMRMRQEQTRMETEAKEAPLRFKGLEQQVALSGEQLSAAQRAGQREVGFNAAFDKINSTKYETPAEKDAAVLAAVSQFKGPEAAAQLQANYSTNERNNILTQGAKFDQTIKQARLKGPAAALKAIDDLNDSFTLEVDGFKVTQVNKDGSRVPFLQAKDANEFAVLVDSRIKDGGAFELAKFRQDEQTKNAQIGYYNALAKKAATEGGAAANQLSGVQVGYARDEKGNPIQVMTALRFNKRSGELESVQVPLERNVVPAAALDPEKISKAAELMVGTPVDPTNKKGPQHTFQTARQAVTDQIFNQYLGTGTPAAGLDLSPAAVAKRMLEGQKPAAAAPANVGLTSPSRSAPVERNPYVDERGRPLANAPAGAPSIISTAVPQAAAAIEGAIGTQASATRYLQSKIERNEPLAPNERARAVQLGLIR